MPRKEEDSLGQDFTRTGEPESPKPPESQRSLGDQSTFGDAGSSVSDVSGLDDALEGDMEVVDLSDRYEIEGVIGKGGMGEVLRARDTRLNRPVAIKRILGQMASNKKALARFLTEAQSVAALNHFNIVQIYDYGRAADGPFIIMELVEGHSLQDKLKEGPLELEAAVEMTCQLCDALSTAHEAGIIHRDIKPANILLTQRGEPKLTDFGLARQDTADHAQTMAGAVLGTIDFMPPEQRQDATLTDARSDLWALAATLYQMVTGRSPKVIRLDAVNESLRPVMGQALEESPDDRYQTVADFRDDLRASFTGRQSEAAADLELGAGECPHCRTTNESSRKFCSKCAESLQMNCLQCEGKIRVWDTVCGECGAKQNELAEARRAEMASRQQQAEKLLKQHGYEAAIRVATGLRGEPDSRFHQLKEWADQFLQDVEQQRKQQLARIADLVQEALQHEKAYDYQAGINTLEQIPEILRDHPIREKSSEVRGLLDRLQEKLEESQRLKQIIRQRVKAKQVTGLLSEVEALLKLQPNRKSILKLRDQLIAHEKKNTAKIADVLAKAVGLRKKCRFEKAAELLKRIPERLLTQEANKLLQDCKTLGALRARALASLAAAIQTGDYETDLSQAEYRTTLKTRAFVDKRFADEYESCQEASAVAERRRNLTKSLVIAGLLITVITLTLGTGLWVRSSKRAIAIAEGLRNEEWEKVLVLDSQNVTALVGRATGRLNSRIPDIDGALSDLNFAEQIDASATGLKPARAAAQRARERADVQKAAAEMAAVQKAVAEKAAAQRARERADVQKAAAERAAVQKAVAEKAAAQKAVTEKAAAQKAVTEKAAAQKAATEQVRIDATILTAPIQKSIGLQFCLIPAGTFRMGSPESEAGREDHETQHQVKITKAFYLSTHEVTQQQYEQVMGYNPSHPQKAAAPKGAMERAAVQKAVAEGANKPVTRVSWNDADEFCRKLSKLEGPNYRLPTEAEWEYACRAGTTTAYSFGNDASQLQQYAWYGVNSDVWYGGNSDGAIHSVGEKPPNPWGLHGMHGNVSEWCQDWYGLYESGEVRDPTGPEQGKGRVLRGGAVVSPPPRSRAAYRMVAPPAMVHHTLGFRVATNYDPSP